MEIKVIPEEEIVIDPTGELNYQQQKFCLEYMVDSNASQAAIRAGYSAQNARKTGSRLLQIPEVKEFIEERQAALREKYMVTHERIIHELALIAFSDMGDFFERDEKPRELLTMEPQKRRAVRSLRIRHSFPDMRCDYKMYDKLRALTELAKLTGMYKKEGKTM